MNRLSERELKAIDRLAGDADFMIFMGWLNNSRINQALLCADIGKEPERTWLQGRVQQLGLIIKAVAEARANLEGLNKNKEG